MKKWTVLIRGVGSRDVEAKGIDGAYAATMDEFGCKLDDILAVLSHAPINPTFHVREQNPSGCWGFARRSSLHGISRRYPRRFAANHPVTRRYAAKKVRRRGERGKSG